jgi:hypothetical protein
MQLLLIPFGIIINTDVSRSVLAFKALIEELDLGIEVNTELKISLNGLFQKYNSGVLTESEFAQALLTAIAAKIPAEKVQNLDPKWQEFWQEKWKSCWNAMCIIDATVIQTCRLLTTNTAVKCCVYSETNPTHLEYINACLAAEEIELSVRTTFDFQNSLVKLLQALVVENADSIARNNCSIMVGNPELVKDEYFRNLAIAKVQSVLDVIVPHNIQVIKLESGKSTLEQLPQIFANLLQVEANSEATQVTSERPRPLGM